MIPVPAFSCPLEQARPALPAVDKTAHLASPGTPAGNCSPALSSPPPRPAPLTTSRCPCENQTGSLRPTRPSRGQVSPGAGNASATAAGGERAGRAFLQGLRGGESRRGAGQLPGIVVEDARRVAQEPVPELRSLPVLSLRHAFREGGRHDTGDGNAPFSRTRGLPVGHAPFGSSGAWAGTWEAWRGVAGRVPRDWGAGEDASSTRVVSPRRRRWACGIEST